MIFYYDETDRPQPDSLAEDQAAQDGAYWSLDRGF
jgi:hypothetical protein